jgi:hypothetical protein
MPTYLPRALQALIAVLIMNLTAATITFAFDMCSGVRAACRELFAFAVRTR